MPLLARIRGALGSLNRQPTLLGAVRQLRHRLPGDPEFGDLTSTAGEPTLAYLVQGVNVLSPEGASLVSEVSLTGLQLWQSLAERNGRGRGPVELALLYADVVDSSSFTLAAGDATAVELLSLVALTVERCVEERGGRIVRRLGDGIIASFVSALAATEAALDVQDALLGIAVQGHSVQMRLGVHWGRPRRLRGEFVGTDVSVLGAIGSAARPGQVLVSAPALAQLDPAFHDLKIGRRKRLRSEDAPAALQVAVVRRA
ncbi:MAG TPA: adenylate/guanylate cyclase domain-containing protein [Solirubrobacteraceae bacterium]|nr:adenylate/guanylate cyclase domain-containing protein [Solirubrobacteraceae bacterium]